MAKLKDQVRKLSGNNPELKVNLRKIFGERIPRSGPLRDQITQEILDLIIDRTKSGKDINSRRFPAYSKSYKNSEEFRAFGKSEGRVNLTLTGDMLGLMDSKESTRDTETFGWTDREEAAKAHGHITGNVGKTRDFFGLRASEIREIRNKFKDQIARINELDEQTQVSAAEVLRRLGVGDES